MTIVDTHVHPPIEEFYRAIPHVDEVFKYFGAQKKHLSLEELLHEFEDAGVDRLVLLGVDAETATGLPRLPNDAIARMIDENPTRLVGFASVDPWKGKVAIRELERSVRDLGLRGLKFHPGLQSFYPNDRRFYPLYEKCIELGVPVLFHGGVTGIGVGLPGGGGVKTAHTNPLHVDEVASELPELKVIISHPAWPWVEEQIAVVMHKGNVYMDLSGWSPRYFPATLKTYLNTRFLSDKCFFGTDYPFISPERWLEDFNRLDLKPENKEKILGKNFMRFLEA
ncbi:MAG: amidohydrolase family protein [Candidatus Geothermarchaeales archaeon]